MNKIYAIHVDGVLLTKDNRYELVNSLNWKSRAALIYGEEINAKKLATRLMKSNPDKEIDIVTYVPEIQMKPKEYATLKRIDQKGSRCDCGGVYGETTYYDDMDGTLHCDQCNKMIKRYLKVPEINSI